MKFIKALLYQAFYKQGKPFLPYIYIWLLLGLVFTVIILRILEGRELSDTLVLGMCGFVLSWIAIFTAGEKKK